eukprot:1695111-Pyramimonas_sp.AAC.1
MIDPKTYLKGLVHEDALAIETKSTAKTKNEVESLRAVFPNMLHCTWTLGSEDGNLVALQEMLKGGGEVSSIFRQVDGFEDFKTKVERRLWDTVVIGLSKHFPEKDITNVSKAASEKEGSVDKLLALQVQCSTAELDAAVGVGRSPGRICKHSWLDGFRFRHPRRAVAAQPSSDGGDGDGASATARRRRRDRMAADRAV